MHPAGIAEIHSNFSLLARPTTKLQLIPFLAPYAKRVSIRRSFTAPTGPQPANQFPPSDQLLSAMLHRASSSSISFVDERFSAASFQGTQRWRGTCRNAPTRVVLETALFIMDRRVDFLGNSRYSSIFSHSCVSLRRVSDIFVEFFYGTVGRISAQVVQRSTGSYCCYILKNSRAFFFFFWKSQF